MANSDFRDDLKIKIGAFLSYYAGAASDDYTKQLRESLAGIAKNDETDAFEFISGKYFLAVIYKADTGKCSRYGPDLSADPVKFHLLSLADNNGEVYYDFNDVPPFIGEEIEGLDSSVACHKLIDNSFPIQSASSGG